MESGWQDEILFPAINALYVQAGYLIRPPVPRGMAINLPKKPDTE